MMNKVDGKKIRFWEGVDGIIVIGTVEDENGPRHVILEPHWKSDEPGLPGHQTITLEEIALQFPDKGCLTVLAEQPLNGHVYRYNNYGKKEWLEIGTPADTHKTEKGEKRMVILPIKKKWFDMIKSGEKLEEYRELKPYYIVRFLKALGFPKTEQESVMKLLRQMEAKKPITVLFRNGYSKASPSFMAQCYLSIGKGKKEWGAVSGYDDFILRIARIY